MVNDVMVQACYQVERLIVEGEQGGKKRAEYGKEFSSTDLKLFRQFYVAFPISHALCGHLDWGV